MDDKILELASRTYDTLAVADSGSPLGHLRKQAEIHQAHTTVTRHYRDLESAEQAAYVATDHAIHNYPATIGALLSDENWQGYPDPTFADAPGSAVAHLGEGVFIHHTSVLGHEAGNANLVLQHTLTLIAPCSCGLGYRTWPVTGEENFLGTIAEATAEHPSLYRHNCRHQCRSVNY
ncbi:hypothetical protein OS965_32795 [Streptomyces sp. H27-G5]|uniref:hypothetical protein n=1 Tax=Streptomyces sp. H27-G5 TaxID=2996698 RepID=UPI00226F6800|nr:hypothetical protein [Streptomyces sp. H27-G5]MCY0922868.1 hypothetical protein [Streptomyces sp. H27-G5]